jgi:hypothetical protein
MKITRDNYEAYFIDLIDGTLPADVVDELLDFMRDNPDLAAELKDLGKMTLRPDLSQTFQHQSLLKTDMDRPGVLQEACIRSIENDWSAEEESKFQLYLKTNSTANEEYRLFRATVSEPDPLLVFENKEALYRKRIIVPFWIPAVAAVLAIAAVFWFSAPQPAGNIATPTLTEAIENELPAPVLEPAATKGNFAVVAMNETNQELKVKALKQVSPTDEAVNEPASALATLTPMPVEEVQTSVTLVLHHSLAAIPEKNIGSELEYIPTIPEYFAQEIAKVDPKTPLRKLGHFALNKLKNISDDKLDYKTAPGGSIHKIEYNSKLLAFSIPLNQ